MVSFAGFEIEEAQIQTSSSSGVDYEAEKFCKLC